MLGPKLCEKYIISMHCEAQEQCMQACQLLTPAIGTEVHFLISFSAPIPTGTQHDHS